MIVKYRNKNGVPEEYELDCGSGRLFDEIVKTADCEIEAPCGGKGICGKCLGYVRFKDTFTGDKSDFAAPRSEIGSDLSGIGSFKTDPCAYFPALICKLPPELNEFIEEVVLPSGSELSGAGTGELAEKESKKKNKFEKTAFAIEIDKPDFDLNGTLAITERVAEDARIYIEKNIHRSVAVELHEKAIPDAVRAANSKSDKIYLTLVLTEEEPTPKYVILRASETKKRLLGAAVDIGTTTVCATVIDLETEDTVGEAVFGNPQRKHGADVISRMQYEEENGGETQTREIRDAVGKAFRDIVNKNAECTLEDVAYTVIAGNSVMQSIYKGIPTAPISKAPFTLPERMGRCVIREDFSLRVEYAEPLPASYVGGDITSGLSYIFAYENAESGNTLFLDLGTNGEIALITSDKNDKSGGKTIYLAATAAGPALEGANIEIGKPAVPGAVTRVRLSDGGGFEFKTVRDEDADGVCGSGIISATATALRVGLLTEYGRICDDGEAENEKYSEIYENYEKYIEEDDNGKLRIKFDENGKIYLTEGDFRQIQTAKAAIAAGIETLLYAAGMTENDIDRVYIAGSFGAGIDVDDAKAIGLLPDIVAPVYSVGNTSAKGAIMYMLDKEVRARVAEIMKTGKYIELSSNPKFTEKFVDNMIFPQP